MCLVFLLLNNFIQLNTFMDLEDLRILIEQKHRLFTQGWNAVLNCNKFVIIDLAFHWNMLGKILWLPLSFIMIYEKKCTINLDCLDYSYATFAENLYIHTLYFNLES